MHWAAASGDKDMMAVLMERTSDVNSPSYSGQTPLHVAAACGHDDIVRLLINDNAQPDISTHLRAACLYNLNVCMTPANVTAVIKGFAHLQFRQSGLYWLPSGCRRQCECSQQLRSVFHGGYAVDLRGDTPLHEAAGAGHVPVCTTLLAGRANPNVANLDLETPLLVAARRGYTGVVEVTHLLSEMP